MMKILHTADWQIGKRFGGFETDEEALLAEARLASSLGKRSAPGMNDKRFPGAAFGLTRATSVPALIDRRPLLADLGRILR